jgi:hypothetical protein
MLAHTHEDRPTGPVSAVAPRQYLVAALQRPTDLRLPEHSLARSRTRALMVSPTPHKREATSRRWHALSEDLPGQATALSPPPWVG